MGSLVGCIAIFVLPLAVVPGYGWLSARVIARHPVECWPPDTVENVEPSVPDFFTTRQLLTQ